MSTILSDLKVSSTLYCVASFSSPWGFRFRYERGAMFYAVVEGECIFIPSSGEARHLSAGDYVVLPRSAHHEILDQRGTPAVPLDQILLDASDSATGTVKYGGGGSKTKIIGGCLWLEGPHLDLVLSALPANIVMKANDARESSLDLLLPLLQKELTTMKFGSGMIISRISDAIFIEAIRDLVQQLPGTEVNWLRAVQDEVVGTALALMHADLSHPWTLEDLAVRAHVSRSTLTARFQTLVGQAPHQYLIDRRIEWAKHLIVSTNLSVGEIALEVGYDSGQALAKAFKNRTGLTPKQVRARAMGKESSLERTPEP